MISKLLQTWRDEWRSIVVGGGAYTMAFTAHEAFEKTVGLSWTAVIGVVSVLCYWRLLRWYTRFRMRELGSEVVQELDLMRQQQEARK
jgi:hypothetical protein